MSPISDPWLARRGVVTSLDASQSCEILVTRVPGSLARVGGPSSPRERRYSTPADADKAAASGSPIVENLSPWKLDTLSCLLLAGHARPPRLFSKTEWKKRASDRASFLGSSPLRILHVSFFSPPRVQARVLRSAF